MTTTHQPKEAREAARREAEQLANLSRGEWSATVHDGGMVTLKHKGGAYAFYKGGSGAELPGSRPWTANDKQGHPLRVGMGGRVRTFGAAGAAIDALQEARHVPYHPWDTPPMAAN